MGRVLDIILTTEQVRELEEEIKHNSNHVIRQRCQMILLKSKSCKTSLICEIIGIKSQNQVNTWIKAYKNMYVKVGLSCLKNAEGQGRKPIFDSQTEAALIQTIVRQERQKLANAKVILEKELNKTFTTKTLKNFLKSLAGDTNQ
ncbi:hypothetical protein VB776_21855 [Arcicella sp. DC2W]|uniref:Helix-turn-helix domain-containing protein n=1 Tax=Arcicella gelida TaxID=2984195 RepID=A0ABU5SAV2_9BACT|nr:hypothetical protein [Arcicella sp. DC2W]MEA5405599.1 hypothetical protein [Arcicella sp. DC2W]